MQAVQTQVKDMTVTLAFCPLDDVAFVIVDSTQRFCSPSCRRAWEASGLKEPPAPRTYEIVLRACRVCKGSFPVRVPHQRCCSKECKTIFDNKYRGYVN